LETGLNTKLEGISTGIFYMIPEIFLSIGILLIILAGLITRNRKNIQIISWLTILIFITSTTYILFNWPLYSTPTLVFEGMIRTDDFSSFFKILFAISGVFTVLMSIRNNELKENKFTSEYYALLTSAVLGAHLLVMSVNFIMVFLSLELLSISSYVLAGYSLTKKGAEGSLKYFLFGSVASATMLYGFSVLFGLSGTLDFSSQAFADHLLSNQTPLLLVAGSYVVGGLSL
jgi:NADH-quinone oxidoreductase subunit N